MKVAFLLANKSNYDSYRGGAVERWVGEFVLRAKQHNYIVISNSSSSLINYFKNGVIGQLLPFNLKNYRRNNLTSYLWCIKNLLIIKKADVLVIENRPEYAVSLRRIKYEGKIYLHIHNDTLKNYNNSYLKKLYNSCDKIIFCSENIKNFALQRCEALAHNSSVVLNGVDSNVFFPSRKENKNPIISFIGRIDKNKGLLFLLETLDNLFTEGFNFDFHIVGEYGRDSQYNLKVSNKLSGMNFKVINHGYLDNNSELPKILNSTDLLIFPSLYTEALPVVLIEASLCQTPILASNIGGVDEIIINDNNLFQPGNSSELLIKTKNGLSEVFNKKII